MTKKRMQIPHVTVDDPNLQEFINAVVHNQQLDNGVHGVSEKRPTVQELIDAAIANADDIV